MKKVKKVKRQDISTIPELFDLVREMLSWIDDKGVAHGLAAPAMCMACGYYLAEFKRERTSYDINEQSRYLAGIMLDCAQRFSEAHHDK